MGATTALTLKDVATGTERSWRSAAARSADPFSPDGKKIAITHTTDSGMRLLIADVATGTDHDRARRRHQRARRRLHLARDSSWLLLPPDPGRPRPGAGEAAGADRSEHPGEHRQRPRPGRTYPGSAHQRVRRALFDYYYATPAGVGRARTATKTNDRRAGRLPGRRRSDDGKYLIVTRVKRPYS